MNEIDCQYIGKLEEIKGVVSVIGMLVACVSHLGIDHTHAKEGGDDLKVSSMQDSVVFVLEFKLSGLVQKVNCVRFEEIHLGHMRPFNFPYMSI